MDNLRKEAFGAVDNAIHIKQHQELAHAMRLQERFRLVREQREAEEKLRRSFGERLDALGAKYDVGIPELYTCLVDALKTQGLPSHNILLVKIERILASLVDAG